MASGFESNQDIDRRAITTAASIATISAITSVFAIAARRWMIWIGGAGTTAGATSAIGATRATETAGAAELRLELAVILHRNIEVGTKIRMAGNRDGDMGKLSITDLGIGGERNHAFLVGGNNSCCDLKILPHDFPVGRSFGDQDLAVWACNGNH